MAENSDISDLTPQQEALIYALLCSKTKQAAAYCAGVPPRTMYHWLRAPDFRAALRAARRNLFDESLVTLERGAGVAAQVLIDELKGGEGIDNERSAFRINAAKAVLDRTFRAQNAISVKEEMTDMRVILAGLKAKVKHQQAARTLPARVEVRTMVTDNTEAYRLRAEWMALIGNGGQDIADSLRYNPPQSIVEEQGMLEYVRTMQAQEKLEAELLERANAEAGVAP